MSVADEVTTDHAQHDSRSQHLNNLAPLENHHNNSLQHLMHSSVVAASSNLSFIRGAAQN